MYVRAGASTAPTSAAAAKPASQRFISGASYSDRSTKAFHAPDSLGWSLRAPRRAACASVRSGVNAHFDHDEMAGRTAKGLRNLVERISPWLFTVGSWVFGGLIAFE